MESPKMKWLLYSIFITLFIFLFISEVGVITSMKNAFVSFPSLGQLEKYVIVFDGGSTGTRVHVFKFFNSSNGNLSIQNEYFEEIKPGLSSYADVPIKAAQSVNSLLDKAKNVIPSDRWQDTPVSLKATAGLRLLPPEKSDAILDEVLHFVKNTPFQCEQTCVSILDSDDEGIFAWFTVNFLLGHVENPEKSAAVLDLGGGSTQVTFAPFDLNTFSSSPDEFLINRTVQKKTLTLYSHSYLGLGLMSARYSILKLTSEDFNDENSDTKQKILRSPCMSSESKVTWRHGLEQYTVKGLKSGEHSYSKCQKYVMEFLKDTVHQPAELQKKDVYALSYYIDRAVNLGLVGSTGGKVTVQQMQDSAKKECSRKTPTKAFLCLDATYIAALLHHGFGLSKQKEIHLVEQLKGYEASWGLGAAFSLL